VSGAGAEGARLVKRFGEDMPVVWFCPVSQRWAEESPDEAELASHELPGGKIPFVEPDVVKFTGYLTLARASADERVRVRVGELKYDFDEADPPDPDDDIEGFQQQSGIRWLTEEFVTTVAELERMIGTPVSNRMLALAAREVKERRIRLGHAAVTPKEVDKNGDSYSDSPRFRASMRAFVAYAARYETQLGPSTNDQNQVGGYAVVKGARDLLGSAARIMTTAHQWNPRGSVSPYQTLRQVAGQRSEPHVEALCLWHSGLFELAQKLAPEGPDLRRPHGYPKDSNGSIWTYWKGALKGLMINKHIDDESTIRLVELIGNDIGSPEIDRELYRLAELGCGFASQDGDRQQMRTDVALFLGPDGLPLSLSTRAKPRTNFDYQQRFGKVVTEYLINGIPEPTSKSRDIAMVSGVVNQLFLLSHKPNYVWLYKPVSRGFKPRGPGRRDKRGPSPRWSCRRWDVRRMDQQLPIWMAAEQSRSRLTNAGYSVYSVIMRLLIYLMPKFLKADRIGEKGMVVLGHLASLTSFNWFAGMPTGVGDGSDTHSETCPVDVLVRLAWRFGKTLSDALIMLIHLIQDDVNGCSLEFRGDGVLLYGPRNTTFDAIAAAIDEPAAGYFMLDYAPANDASFDGEMPVLYVGEDEEVESDDYLHRGEGEWVKDFVALWYRLAHGEKSIRWSACPGQSLTKRIEAILTSKSGQDLLSAYNQCFSWLWNGSIEDAAATLRRVADLTQLNLTEIEQRILDDPAQVGRYIDDPEAMEQISPQVLAFVYIAIPIAKAEKFRRAANKVQGSVPNLGHLVQRQRTAQQRALFTMEAAERVARYQRAA